MKTLQKLMDTLPQRGRVEWIGLRPARGEPPIETLRVAASMAQGLVGERYSTKDGKRQVTLIQAEHLEAVASMLGIDALAAALVRRNVVVRGINLLALKNRAFQVGSAILVYTGPCHPCSRMEQVLGAGGYNAMRGHGGITARVLRDGNLQVGDEVAAVESAPG